MTRLLFLALALAANAFADDVEKRLEPFVDPDPSRAYGVHAAVLDRYKSGHPRRVVAAIGNSGEGKLMLFRFPDSDAGEPRVLDEQTLDSGAGDVEVMRIIHPQDIVVSLFVRHGETAIVEHVVRDRLVKIADDFGEAIDLDGDGVPEILSAGYLGQNDCGVETGAFLAHWNGKRFVNDGREYADVLGIYGTSTEDEVHLFSSKRYAVRLFGPGRVLLDGKALQPGKPFRTEESCHTIELRDGTAKTRALLEELP